MQSLNKRSSILANAELLVIGIIISKVLGFCREWVIAYKYGTGAISDAFILTNSIPTTLFVSLATAITVNYIPISMNCKSDKDINEFTSNIIGIATLIMVIGSIVIEIFASGVVFCFAPGLDATTKAYALKMLRIVVFSIFPIIYSYIFQGYSQVNGKFRTTAVYGIAINVVMIIIILVSDSNCFYLLSTGYVLAYVLGMIICLFESHKNGFRYSFALDFRNERIKRIALLTLPLMIENLASSMSLIVDKILGSYLESGTISGLGYASTLGNIATTMIASAIITAVYPVLSKSVADNQIESFKKIFNKYALLIIILLSPISAFMIYYAKELTVIIFQHGAFANTSTRIVWQAMACYAVGIVPNGIQTYFVKAFYSMQETKAPVIIKVLSLMCNIVLNIVLVSSFKHIGIALSTSLSYFISMVLLCILFDKKFNMKEGKNIAISMFKSIALALLIGFIVRLTIGRSILNPLLNVVLSGIIFVGTYFAMMLLMMQEEQRNELIRLIKGRLSKK